MITAGLFVCFAHSSGSHKGDRPLCNMRSIGILEVLLAAVMLPVRNLLLKLYVEVPPSQAFWLLCQQVMPVGKYAISHKPSPDSDTEVLYTYSSHRHENME